MNQNKFTQGNSSQINGKTAGFTLIEMLVVMVLLGLITSILFQGLGLIGKVQQRLIPKIQQQQRSTLQELWFRQSISGLMAGIDRDEMFIGSPEGFSGLSVSPLHTPFGAPAMIHWAINNNHNQQILSYQQSEDLHWQIQSLPASQNSLQFIYLDLTGNWLPSWNLKGSDLNQASLPEAIALKTYAGETERWWIASVNGEKQPSWWLLDNE